MASRGRIAPCCRAMYIYMYIFNTTSEVVDFHVVFSKAFSLNHLSSHPSSTLSKRFLLKRLFLIKISPLPLHLLPYLIFFIYFTLFALTKGILFLQYFTYLVFFVSSTELLNISRTQISPREPPKLLEIYFLKDQVRDSRGS